MLLLVNDDHTIILGGGIVGVSAAYFLAKRGCRVTLVDRGAFDTCASTGNAGIIALGHPPLPRPGLVKQTLRMILDPANPLYIPVRFDPALFRWLWDFRKACTQAHFERSMAILAELGWAAGETFDQLVEDEALDCEYHRTGWLDVFQTEQRMAQGIAEAELLRSYGYEVQILDSNELQAREPAFRPSVRGASHYTDSRFANPGQFLSQLADRAKRHGANLLTEHEAASIIISYGRFTGVNAQRINSNRTQVLTGTNLVLAGGAWTTQLARSIGINVPMQPGKGYHIDVVLPEGSPRVSTTSVLAETFIAVTPIDSSHSRESSENSGLRETTDISQRALRLAGTVELSGMNHRMVRKRLEKLRTGAMRYLYGIEEATTASSWCGLRPCTADGLPVIGWAPSVQNVFIATGHAMMGFALGPITGKLISEAILGGDAQRTNLDLTPLSPARYA